MLCTPITYLLHALPTSHCAGAQTVASILCIPPQAVTVLVFHVSVAAEHHDLSANGALALPTRYAPACEQVINLWTTSLVEKRRGSPSEFSHRVSCSSVHFVCDAASLCYVHDNSNSRCLLPVSLVLGRGVP